MVGDDPTEKKTDAPKHLWPTWWDGIDHPDVPFPKFRTLLGENPGPEEILRRAKAIQDEENRDV